MATTTTQTETNGQTDTAETTDTSNDGTGKDIIQRIREFVVSPLGMAFVVAALFLVLVLVQVLR